ncbi:MAG: CopG family transcriptional regulator [Spirochaetaceae bacterium]|nr:CopG family transcriptional regulator [Spirochaetaceae bacterium]
MSRTVTLRLKDAVYERLCTLAEGDNRSLSNFIETATLRYLEQEEYVDEFEMREIRGNQPLNESIARGLEDAMEKRGRYV